MWHQWMLWVANKIFAVPRSTRARYWDTGSSLSCRLIIHCAQCWGSADHCCWKAPEELASTLNSRIVVYITVITSGSSPVAVLYNNWSVQQEQKWNWEHWGASSSDLLDVSEFRESSLAPSSMPEKGKMRLWFWNFSVVTCLEQWSRGNCLGSLSLAAKSWSHLS